MPFVHSFFSTERSMISIKRGTFLPLLLRAHAMRQAEEQATERAAARRQRQTERLQHRLRINDQTNSAHTQAQMLCPECDQAAGRHKNGPNRAATEDATCGTKYGDVLRAARHELADHGGFRRTEGSR